ncbi:hypothetical protein DAPPUDRAFT_244224 [Daphnia pulex]|uniref:Uncharacterized protein n=1 Tax=Daphnia pulex TaxID=6669 RepID=E9GKH2_DAPPU|nr:hypothetical protein DAPPUDRAFT_244224 [Daphnia pulex]|eukprot:EFX79992.1 hypothetical protein DAPPUDRAFT_244224 [Daphnia pulex]
MGHIWVTYAEDLDYPGEISSKMLMANFPTPELIEETTLLYKRLARTPSGSIRHPIKKNDRNNARS